MEWNRTIQEELFVARDGEALKLSVFRHNARDAHKEERADTRNDRGASVVAPTVSPSAGFEVVVTSTLRSGTPGSLSTGIDIVTGMVARCPCFSTKLFSAKER